MAPRWRSLVFQAQGDESVILDPGPSVANSLGFVAFAKRFCINPVYVVGRYKKRKGWVVIDLATRAETYFKTMRDARQHLVRLYTEAAPKKIATEALA
jgi:hypothetical protein